MRIEPSEAACREGPDHRELLRAGERRSAVNNMKGSPVSPRNKTPQMLEIDGVSIPWFTASVARRGRLRFELSGPGMTPRAVDSILMLRLAQETFRLVKKVAESAGITLTLAGLDVKDKCVAVDVQPSDQGAADIALRRALRLVAGQEIVPRGLAQSVDTVRKDLRGLPPSVTARVQATGRAKRLQPPPLPTTELPWEVTELRVMPIRVGGREPGAQLTSLSELGPFTVEVTAEAARHLGALLYREVDVVVRIVRGVDGRIERGTLVEIHPLSEGEPAATWRAWFATNAPEWDTIDDVRGTLGRGTDD